MNAPHFNTEKLPETFGSFEWMNAVIAEEHRCCDAIDARYKKINDEYVNLCREKSHLQAESNRTTGFLASFRISSKLRKIEREMKWRRDVMDELLDARLARTYGG